MTPFVIYTLVTAWVVLVLLVLLAAALLRERRRGGRDAVLGSRYLQIVTRALMTGEKQSPRFPMMGRAGTRRLLAQTIAGIVSVTYGLDPEPLRRIVVDNGLDEWVVRAVRRSRGMRRARYLSLLAALPTDQATVLAARKYLADADRYVRFQALLVQVAADASTAFKLMSAYPDLFSACEVSQLMTLLRRGMLPIAYEPLILSPNSNLRRVGLGIIRQFGIEQAERSLLRIAAEDSLAELRREALYALCAMKQSLARREVSRCIAQMAVADRRAVLRYMVNEGYAPDALPKVLDERERPYFESLVQSHKRCLV